MTTVSHLPNEILLHIFNYLDVKDLARCRLVRNFDSKNRFRIEVNKLNY